MFKLEQFPNFKKNKTRTSQNLNLKKHSLFSLQNFQSLKTKKTKFENYSVMKTLEKNIQQKILDISMQIEKESSLINSNQNKKNLSLFIKKKIESENDHSSFFSKNNTIQKNIRNKTFSEKKININVASSPIDENKKTDFSCILFSKYKKRKRKREREKYRVLFKKKAIYDSFDSEEEEEIEQLFISPDNKFILLIDSLVIISTLFNMLYTPYYLSIIKCFCSKMKANINNIYYFIDVLYIIDLLFGFFRAYHNFQLQIITNYKRIIRHYLITQFAFDLIQAIPFFSFMCYYCKKSNNFYNCTKFNMESIHILLVLFCMLKHLKIFKILNIKKNSIYYKLKLFVSKYDFGEKVFNFFLYLIVCLFSIYF